jgi:hypothetical protein
VHEVLPLLLFFNQESFVTFTFVSGRSTR